MEIDSNGIKITSGNITLTGGFKTCIVDKIQQQTEDCNKFNKYIYGLWEENNLKKEGKQMIESYNLVDLYFNKCKENVEQETKKKIDVLKGQSQIAIKFIQLVEQFEKDCDELYMSQFSEEEKQATLLEQDCLDDSNMELKKCESTNYDYYIDTHFKPKGYDEIMNERNKKIDELNSLSKVVKSHIGIAKNKEEVEEILKRYEILDKKGKLVQP